MAKLSNDQIKTRFAAARRARESGDIATAVRGFSQLLKDRPDLAEAQFNLAEIFALKGQRAEAAKAFEAALNLRPSEPAIWLSYMDLVLDHPDLEGVIKMVDRAKGALSHHALIYYFEGRLLKRQGLDPVRALDKAIQGGVKQERLYLDLADAQAASGEVSKALATFEFGLKDFPKSAVLLSQKADLLRDTAQFPEALKTAKAAIKIQPENGHLYHSYASIQKFKADDPLIDQMKSLFARKTSKHPDRRYLAFALAKAMEDTGQSQSVFNYLNLGNKDFDRDFPYGYEADKQDMQAIRALAERLDEKFPKSAGHSDKKPIFVTGMPRSGTSLVEQIIGAHSSVKAGGELGALGPELAKFRKHAGAIGSDAAMSHAMSGHAKAYLKVLDAQFDSEFVTDKSISTFANIGLVKRLLPNAKIVVVTRDPRDNAFSIYKNLFRAGLHRYSTNLKNIARFTRLFEAQMAYWSESCPEAFYTIEYEALTAEPETQTRALIDAVGLPWEENCLAFHQNRNRVKTLSSVQVRQPIYATSTKAWENHADDLSPFIDEYERLAPKV